MKNPNNFFGGIMAMMILIMSFAGHALFLALGSLWKYAFLLVHWAVILHLINKVYPNQ